MEPKQNTTNSMAVVALVMGLLGFLFLPFIGSVLAIVFGVIGRKQVKAQGGEGRYMATAGLWLGIVGVVLCVLAAIFITIAIIAGSKSLDNDRKNEETTQQVDNDAQYKYTESTTKTLEGTMLPDFTPVASVPTLQTIDLTPGTGREVAASDTVTVDYTGALASNGKIFESSKDSGQTATFPLNGVIEGWSKGLVGMKEGGTRRLLIPAQQAYGAQGAGSIPPNADLVFDVTLHKIGE